MGNLKGLLILASFFLLSACGPTLPPLNFSPPNIGVSSVKLDAEVRSLTVSVGRPDQQTGEVNMAMIESANPYAPGTGATVMMLWKNALQESFDRMVIFKDDAEKKVSLAVKVLKMETPPVGFSFTTDATARYEIIDRKNGDIIFTTDINSSGTVDADYAFYGITRARESVNRAVQNNILSFLQALETVDLNTPMFPTGSPMSEKIGATPPQM